MLRPTTKRTSRLLWPALLSIAVLAASACGDDGKSAATTTTAATPAATGASVATTVPESPLVAGVAPKFSADRCAKNKAAGKITFLTGFQYAPAVAIADVVTAKAKGYYDLMCLDVDIQVSSPATAAPIVGANRAQFASASSATFDAQVITGGANVIIVSSMAKTSSSELILLPDGVKTVAELKGKIIGVSGTITGDVGAMLAKNGVATADVKTVDKGFDPRIITSGRMDAIIGFKSNEPFLLDQAGIKYKLFDPTDYGVVGSFGNIMANKDFVKQNPTATADFVRATLKGFEYGAANPAEAVNFCKMLTQGDFNVEGGLYRWNTEVKLTKSSTPAGTPIGKHIPKLWEDEVGVAITLGLLKADPAHPITDMYTNDFVNAAYDSKGVLIWPTS